MHQKLTRGRSALSFPIGLTRTADAKSFLSRSHRLIAFSSARASALIALIIFALGTAQSGFSADFVSQWSGSRHDWIFSIAPRGQDQWAAGSLGLMVAKPGTGWTEVLSTAPLSLLSVAFAPDGSGVASGQMGTLLEVAPNSDNWAKANLHAKNRLFSVASSPAGEFIVVGAYGTVLDRPASSHDWHPIPLGFTGLAIPNLYAVHFVDPRKVVIVGESGAIVTLDSGRITKSVSGKESLFAVTSCGGMLVSGGQSGIVKTSEDGKVWTESRIDGGPDVYGFGCLPDGRLVASSSWFIMVGTRQGPSWSWQKIRPPGDIPWFQAVVPSQGGMLLISGQGGIWKTELDHGK
jgi:photosystem II stability/assembly factor-like uncharacterized protein